MHRPVYGFKTTTYCFQHVVFILTLHRAHSNSLSFNRYNYKNQFLIFHSFQFGLIPDLLIAVVKSMLFIYFFQVSPSIHLFVKMTTFLDM